MASILNPKTWPLRLLPHNTIPHECSITPQENSCSTQTHWHLQYRIYLRQPMPTPITMYPLSINVLPASCNE
jgi:hypothetical protein